MNNEEIINKEFDKRKQKWLDTNCTEFINDDNILYDEEKGLFLKLMNEARFDTAKEIFEELREKFYVICKEVNVEGGYLNKSEFNDGCRNFREFERKWVD